VVFRLGFAGSERRKQPRMSGIERDTEERGRARVSLPDGARMRARRRGRSRSPGGRGASTGGEAGRARRVGAEVLAGGVRLRGQGRQRGGERRLVGGWPPPAGRGGGLDFGTLGFLVRAWESDGDWVCYEQREGRPGGLQPPHPPFIRIQRRAVARHALAPRARRLLVLLFLRLPSFKSHANTIEEGMQKFAI
jgi:hypothetical protein